MLGIDALMFVVTGMALSSQAVLVPVFLRSLAGLPTLSPWPPELLERVFKNDKVLGASALPVGSRATRLVPLVPSQFSPPPEPQPPIPSPPASRALLLRQALKAVAAERGS